MAKQAQKWPFCEQGYIPNDLQHGRSMTVGRSWRYLGEKAAWNDGGGKTVYAKDLKTARPRKRKSLRL